MHKTRQTRIISHSLVHFRNRYHLIERKMERQKTKVGEDLSYVVQQNYQLSICKLNAKPQKLHQHQYTIDSGIIGFSSLREPLPPNPFNRLYFLPRAFNLSFNSLIVLAHIPLSLFPPIFCSMNSNILFSLRPSPYTTFALGRMATFSSVDVS